MIVWFRLIFFDWRLRISTPSTASPVDALICRICLHFWLIPLLYHTNMLSRIYCFGRDSSLKERYACQYMARASLTMNTLPSLFQILRSNRPGIADSNDTTISLQCRGIDWFIDWCFTPTLAVFQLYRVVNKSYILDTYETQHFSNSKTQEWVRSISNYQMKY